MALDLIVPQRFQFDRCQYFSRFPEESDHFAVDVQWTVDITCRVQNAFEDAAKALRVDPPLFHELRHRRSRIKHQETTGSTSFACVYASALELGFERAAMCS